MCNSCYSSMVSVAHTMMILMQAIILNVAFNSHNKNLLTVMMSNNVSGSLLKSKEYNYYSCNFKVNNEIYRLKNL